MSRPDREHRAARPSWRCSGCGAPWPCQPAKLALLTEYGTDRLALLLYLATRMVDAAGELPTTVNVVERFLSWARRR